jgi:hypothetical protein
MESETGKADVATGVVTDQEILDFVREVAVEGYLTDEEIVQQIGWAMVHEHPGHPDLPARIARLAPPVFEELHEAEASWPIPTDNDRLDRAFAALEKDGIHTLQDWYRSQEVADEEMRHELKFRKPGGHPYRGFAFFHGGDTRRAVAGEGLRLTWGAAVKGNVGKARRERAHWEVAQDIHRALWEQGLSPSWSQAIGDPITLPFTWQRRRKRYPPPRPPEPPPSPAELRFEANLAAWEANIWAGMAESIERLAKWRKRRGLRVVKPPPEPPPEPD